MSESVLLDRTRQLYTQRRRDLSAKQIAKETGIPLSWLQDFGWARTTNPGVINVEKLYVYLSGKTLDLGA